MKEIVKSALFAILILFGLNLFFYLFSFTHFSWHIVFNLLGGLVLFSIVSYIEFRFANKLSVRWVQRILFWWVLGSLLVLLLLVLLIVKGFFLKFLLRHNFAVSMMFVSFLLQFTLRKRILGQQTWKKITEVWLKWSGVPAFTVGGFGVVATNEEIVGKYLKVAIDSEYVDTRLLISFYIASVFMLALAFLLTQIGKSLSDGEDSNEPKRWFWPAFLFAWLGNLGLYSLFFNGIILTMYAHLVVPR